MCSHYEALRAYDEYLKYFDVLQPTPPQGEFDMWPRRTGTFIRKPPQTDPHDEAVPAREAVLGRWGLVPWRTTAAGADKQLKLATFNARDDRVAKSFTFAGAWQRAQHCIIPAEAFYEPDWRSTKAVPTRFTRADGEPMGIAGLWDIWTAPGAAPLLSYTMLTIGATDHAMLKDYHRPDDEKRMVVVLPESRYREWLEAPAAASMAMLKPYPADRLIAEARPRPPKTKAATPEA